MKPADEGQKLPGKDNEYAYEDTLALFIEKHIGTGGRYWSANEVQLVRLLLPISKPGDLNRKEYLDWVQIAAKMSQLARLCNISNKTYIEATASNQFYLGIKPWFVKTNGGKDLQRRRITQT
jgi:hypothetical protein